MRRYLELWEAIRHMAKPSFFLILFLFPCFIGPCKIIRGCLTARVHPPPAAWKDLRHKTNRKRVRPLILVRDRSAGRNLLRVANDQQQDYLWHLLQQYRQVQVVRHYIDDIIRAVVGARVVLRHLPVGVNLADACRVGQSPRCNRCDG